MSLYCLDTSILVESWWRLYPPDSFSSFWEKLEAGIVNNNLIAPEIVLEELSRQDDELFEWFKKEQRHQLFVPFDADIQQVQADIINNFPRLTMQQKNRSLADPWVIALAQIKQCPVVSMENPGSDAKPKIPNVCNHLGIGHIDVVGLIRAMGWKF
ncbi:MAG: DUF4411 family protein [Bdellovibrionales bacterium]|nr:DUF4411 family protein [Bdellovibrionales bacterium]